MAEESKGNNPMGDVWFIILLLVGLIILWYANGGPSRANLRGIFLAPPPPLGTGQSYGPTYGSSTVPTQPAQQQ